MAHGKTVAQARAEHDAACDAVDAAITAMETSKSPSPQRAASLRENHAAAVEAAEVTKLALRETEDIWASRARFTPSRSDGTFISVSEPDMYTAENPTFLRDLYAAQVKGDLVARERISAHHSFEIEKYAVSTGSLGGIVPPQYLVNLYAKAQRFGRVLADQCTSQELPDEGMSVIVPRLTSGTAAGIQASESTTISTADPAETDLSIPVRTIAGYSPVSRQTLERASYSEQILFEDLIARYNATLDTQLISGTGSSGQHLGILNTSSISTATISSWTIANMVAALYGESGVATAINSWAATVAGRADKIVMHPRRWGAMTTLLDTTNRPLFGIDAGPMNVIGAGDVSGYGEVGRVAGLPIYLDANIPTNLGGGTNEDRIICMASPAVLLWERRDDPVTLGFEQQAGSALQVQLVAYGYSAFTAGRYPAATGVISGAGLT